MPTDNLYIHDSIIEVNDKWSTDDLINLRAELQAALERVDHLIESREQ